MLLLEQGCGVPESLVCRMSWSEYMFLPLSCLKWVCSPTLEVAATDADNLRRRWSVGPRPHFPQILFVPRFGRTEVLVRLIKLLLCWQFPTCWTKGKRVMDFVLVNAKDTAAGCVAAVGRRSTKRSLKARWVDQQYGWIYVPNRMSYSRCKEQSKPLMDLPDWRVMSVSEWTKGKRVTDFVLVNAKDTAMGCVAAAGRRSTKRSLKARWVNQQNGWIYLPNRMSYSRCKEQNKLLMNLPDWRVMSVSEWSLWRTDCAFVRTRHHFSLEPALTIV